jgi:hypothetical protein
MPDLAAPLPAKPAGTQRNLGLMILWMLLTFNIYWVFWLYKTYKEVRAHSPFATGTNEGRAAWFLLIPIFNIFWFFYIVVDFPRAIRAMQEDDRLGEPLLANGMVSSLLIAGMICNLASNIHPAFLLLGEPLLIVGLLLAQRSLNEHWARHALGVAPASPGLGGAPAVIQPVLPPGLGGFLGLRGPAMEWGPGVAFFVAWLLSDLSGLLIWPLLQGEHLPPAWVWGHNLFGALLLGLVVITVFRWIANDFAAAFLAAGVYTLVASVVRFYLFSRGYDYPHAHIIATVSAFAWPLLTLLALAIALRIIRSAWLAIWAGSVAGSLLSALTFSLVWVLVLRLSGDQGSFHVSLSASDLLTDLAEGTVFAFVFSGGAQLMRSSSS